MTPEKTLDLADRITKSEWPLSLFTLFLVMVLGTIVFAMVRRNRKQSENRDKVCQWKIAHLLKITFEQNTLIGNMDRRMRHQPVQMDQRKGALRSVDEISGHILRVVAGPATQKELEDIPDLEG